jgi:hypothetical protein
MKKLCKNPSRYLVRGKRSAWNECLLYSFNSAGKKSLPNALWEMQTQCNAKKESIERCVQLIRQRYAKTTAHITITSVV